MILKASQRGGAKQLGLHLLKTEENEHVEVHEIRGFVSDNIVGALKEAYAISMGTKCKQFMFSVSLNPPETENVGVDVFESTIDTIEERNGLSDHPRVIVFHEKEGRRHAHAVWSRIDAESMTAVNLPFFKTKLRDISRDLYLEHEWQMPHGLMDSEARDPRNYDLAEYQQAKRMGVDARDLKAEMQECWAVSDSKAAFEHALGERGMILAKGDRRGHVAVTHDGEVLSVARYIGKKAKEVVAKIGQPEDLPSVDEAKTRQVLDMRSAFQRHADAAQAQFTSSMAELDEQRDTIKNHHQAERAKLDAAQKERQAEENQARLERFNRGLRGLWDRVTGHHSKLRKENEQEAFAALQRDRMQRDAMVRAQLDERRMLQGHIKDLRDQQAALLWNIRKDKREIEPPPVQEPRLEKQKSNDDRLAEYKQTAASQSRSRSDFARAATQGSEERLRELRNQTPDKTPESKPRPEREL